MSQCRIVESGVPQDLRALATVQNIALKSLTDHVVETPLPVRDNKCIKPTATPYLTSMLTRIEHLILLFLAIVSNSLTCFCVRDLGSIKLGQLVAVLASRIDPTASVDLPFSTWLH